MTGWEEGYQFLAQTILMMTNQGPGVNKVMSNDFAISCGKWLLYRYVNFIRTA